MPDYFELTSKLNSLAPLVESIKVPRITELYKFLKERIASPESFILLLGETSSGKSTLVNSLIGNPLLPMKAYPSTGAISEVVFLPDLKEEEYCVIKKDFGTEKISKSEMQMQVEQPDDSVARVKISIPAFDRSIDNIHVFDTPGYDSILTQHEEVLKEFLPNSDIIVYTVSYRIGIQDNDRLFLNYVREVVREDVDFVLVINRCPEEIGEDNRRIKEIVRYAEDTLLKKPKSFLVQTATGDEDEYVLPQTEDLWKYVVNLAKSEKRGQLLYNVFSDYIRELYDYIGVCLDDRRIMMELDYDELREVQEAEINAAKEMRNAVKTIVEPGYERISELLPRRMQEAADNAQENIVQEISGMSDDKMEEMRVYTCEHLVPFYIKKEEIEIQEFLRVYLEEINSKVEDNLNKQITLLHESIQSLLPTSKEKQAWKAGKRLAYHYSYHGLFAYFLSYGGAGGANAGIANAASHALKMVGDAFGTKFSLATHNALKHTLANIGATSMYTVSGVLVFLVEFISGEIEKHTWKRNLIKKTKKAVEDWETKHIEDIREELEKSKKNNIELITEIADEIEHTYQPLFEEQEFSKEEFDNIINIYEEIGNAIGGV